MSLEERGVNPYKEFTVVCHPIRKRQKKHYKLWKIPMNCGILFGKLPADIKFSIFFLILFSIFSINFVTVMIVFACTSLYFTW